MPEKSKRTKKVDQELKDKPHLESEALLEIAEDADRYHALKIILDSEGGELLVASLLDDVLASVETLSVGYRTLTLQDFIGLSARINTSLSLARTITRSAENLKGADELLTEKLHE